MTAKWRSRDRIIPSLGVLLLGVIFLVYQTVDWRMMHHAFLSGYTLILLLLGVALLPLRKRLPGLPIGLMSTWLRVHIVIGVVLLPVFWLHIGGIWPNGLFEQLLAAAYYLVTLSGLSGRLLQKILPTNLTSAGGEIIRERIPREIIHLRLEVERIIVDCTEETGKRSLATAYEQTLSWYFRRPRFILPHVIGASNARHWFDHHANRLSRTLDQVERGSLDQIHARAERKHRLDFHYALQNLLRLWLFVHVPSAVALYVFATWHVALVHVYAQ